MFYNRNGLTQQISSQEEFLMKNLLKFSLAYLIAGLAVGVFFREFTKLYGFAGETALAAVHTHLLILGMLMFLLLLLFEKAFSLSSSKKWRPFLYFYNIGIALTAALMLMRGILQVQGIVESAAVAGIAGIGHILTAIGLIFLFLSLFERVSRSEK